MIRNFAIFCWSGLILGNAICATPLSSQDAREFAALLVAQERIFTIFQEYEGELVKSQESNGLVPIIDFFTSDTIVEEIGLQDDQIQKIESHFREFERLIKALKKMPDESKKTGGDERRGPGDEREAALDAATEFVKNSNSELSTSQKKRLREIQWRFLLFRNGIKHLLKSPSVSDMLGLDSSSLADIPRSAYTELTAIEKQLATQALDMWLEDLTEEQRKLFDRDWGNIITGRGGLGQLALFLEYEKVAPIPAGKEKGFMAKAANIPLLLHGANGNIVTEILEETETREYSEVQRLYGMFHLLSSPFVVELVEMVDDQSEEIAKISLEFRIWSRDVVAGIAGEMGIAIRDKIQSQDSTGNKFTFFLYEWPEDMTEIDRIREKKLEERASEFTKRLEDVLLPLQREQLQEIRDRVIVRCHGPWADIERGPLGKIMNLSEEQLKKLDGRRSKTVKFIEEETRRAANDFLIDRLEGQPAGLRSKLRKALGEPIGNGYVDLSMIANSWQQQDLQQ